MDTDSDKKTKEKLMNQLLERYPLETLVIRGVGFTFRDKKIAIIVFVDPDKYREVSEYLPDEIDGIKVFANPMQIAEFH